MSKFINFPTFSSDVIKGNSLPSGLKASKNPARSGRSAIFAKFISGSGALYAVKKTSQASKRGLKTCKFSKKFGTSTGSLSFSANSIEGFVGM